MPRPRSFDETFFDSWSLAMAYAVGYFAADGSMICNNRGAKFIEFASTDRILLEQIKDLTKASHSISERKRRSDLWAPQYRLQIGSKSWFAALECLGFTPNKSTHMKLPQVPASCFGAFLRGYFDGDGCAYFGGAKTTLLTTFTSGSRSFLLALWRSLRTKGVVGGSLVKKERGFTLSFSRRDSLALHRLMYHTGQVPDLCLPRKRQKLERGIRVLGLGSCGRSSTG